MNEQITVYRAILRHDDEKVTFEVDSRDAEVTDSGWVAYRGPFNLETKYRKTPIVRGSLGVYTAELASTGVVADYKEQLRDALFSYVEYERKTKDDHYKSLEKIIKNTK